MANKRAETLEMRMRLETREVKSMHLGVTLPGFTQWAFPYILINDGETNWAASHDIEELVGVCHTDELQEFERRPVQFVITKPLQNAQTYPHPPPAPGQLPTTLCPCLCGKMAIGTWIL